MSEAAPEATGFEAKLEALAAQGFHLVVSEAEKFVIEKVDHAGTVAFRGASLAEAIAAVEEKLGVHPGSSVDVISRSDGLHESRDLLETQAGKPEAPEGQSGTTPAPAREAVVPVEPEESAPVAEAPGEVVTGRVGEEPEAPEAAPAPEGSVES